MGQFTETGPVTNFVTLIEKNAEVRDNQCSNAHELAVYQAATTDSAKRFSVHKRLSVFRDRHSDTTPSVNRASRRDPESVA